MEPLGHLLTLLFHTLLFARLALKNRCGSVGYAQVAAIEAIRTGLEG